MPPAKVILTGITSLFGPSSKRALLEITQQEPGKPPMTNKPILKEGEKFGEVEIVSIDVEKSSVKIKNSGMDADLVFEQPGKSAGGAAPGGPRPIGTPMASYNPPTPPPSLGGAAPNTGGPIIISPGSAENSSRGNSTSVFGAQAPAPAPAGASVTSSGVPTALGSMNGALQSIPVRTVRTETANVDPVQQYATMMLQKQYYDNQAQNARPNGNGQQKAIIMPPLPPIPGEGNSGGAAGGPPVPGAH